MAAIFREVDATAPSCITSARGATIYPHASRSALTVTTDAPRSACANGRLLKRANVCMDAKV